MPSADRIHRGVFDAVADRYDRIRPGYPDGLFADLRRLAGVGPGCRLLEVGCGTGQATVPLAEAGCRIVAVELGANLAARAAENLARFPDVTVEVAAFEDWTPPPEKFDVVFTATAWHWLDPAVRVAKAASLLRPGGALAIVETEHVAGGTTAFFEAAQGCYARFDPTCEPDFHLPEDVRPDVSDVDFSGLFTPTITTRHTHEAWYTAAEYRDLILTYSPSWVIPESNRVGLTGCLADLIGSRFGGRIAKRYLTLLRLAYHL